MPRVGKDRQAGRLLRRHRADRGARSQAHRARHRPGTEAGAVTHPPRRPGFSSTQQWRLLHPPADELRVVLQQEREPRADVSTSYPERRPTTSASHSRLMQMRAARSRPAWVAVMSLTRPSSGSSSRSTRPSSRRRLTFAVMLEGSLPNCSRWLAWASGTAPPTRPAEMRWSLPSLAAMTSRSTRPPLARPISVACRRPIWTPAPRRRFETKSSIRRAHRARWRRRRVHLWPGAFHAFDSGCPAPGSPRTPPQPAGAGGVDFSSPPHDRTLDQGSATADRSNSRDSTP